MQITRTDSRDTRFRQLAAALEDDLRLRDGEAANERALVNEIGFLPCAIVATVNHEPIACGAFHMLSADRMEIKRMFVVPAFRRRSAATIVLKAIEQWAIEMGFQRSLLETGLNQPEAIAFYQRNGYQQIPLFGAYIANENSICFEKKLDPKTI